MRINTVRAELRADRPQVGTWLSMASPIAARYMARSGFRWLTLDIEHSPADWETAAIIFGLIADAGCVPLARVPSISRENAKRALDAGAFGVIFPMCNSREEAEEAVAACRYAPIGRRSVGGGMFTLNFGATSAEYFERANDEILVIIQAEHVQAVDRCEEILSVPGVDAMFIGPNDLLASMGKAPAMESPDDEFVAALRRLCATARRFGVAPGIHCGTVEQAHRRIDEGFRFVAISSELGFMLAETSRVVGGLTGATSGEGPVRY
ncbi:MAG: 2-dehydro-3-deoxyglucarate aldolase [Chthonomonadales bacterium]|nr:2-dehydro-3-deoxyglucarate aldolase [Chthonomonadales bacterium]